MTFLATAEVKYSPRIARAELLASRYPFSKEVLSFYIHLAKFQKELHESLPKKWGKRPFVPADGNLRSEVNLPPLLPSFQKFLSLIESFGPAPLAAEARAIKKLGESAWSLALEEFWKSGLRKSSSSENPPGSAEGGPLQGFLTRAFLQPCAEFVASAMLPPSSPMTDCCCPRCNSLPLLGVLRPEGDGGKRFLQCSLCSQEWGFLRILCANCGENREEKLPVYTAEQFPHLRMETCETCKHFLRTIDLTKDGNAVPLVDDLAAIPLTLWAKEHGYRRIQENLLGT
jgi:formate dehydrogenase maturation protein FdhE